MISKVLITNSIRYPVKFSFRYKVPARKFITGSRTGQVVVKAAFFFFVINDRFRSGRKTSSMLNLAMTSTSM